MTAYVVKAGVLRNINGAHVVGLLDLSEVAQFPLPFPVMSQRSDLFRAVTILVYARHRCYRQVYHATWHPVWLSTHTVLRVGVEQLNQFS